MLTKKGKQCFNRPSFLQYLRGANCGKDSPPQYNKLGHHNCHATVCVRKIVVVVASPHSNAKNKRDGKRNKGNAGSSSITSRSIIECFLAKI